ncbi:hypothetical protein B0H17DRAFT_217156 [Mycena rosella]|uniref:Uncharacterized protein n=1 Tax=Mycena rosella TaxID=1033263 RepID=A0AAD7CZ05_MYCRO|nr:hypothetical protein B0H17DRAFT_217156 [Mycena rosella]
MSLITSTTGSRAFVDRIIPLSDLDASAIPEKSPACPSPVFLRKDGRAVTGYLIASFAGKLANGLTCDPDLSRALCDAEQASLASVNSYLEALDGAAGAPCINHDQAHNPEEVGAVDSLLQVAHHAPSRIAAILAALAGEVAQWPEEEEEAHADKCVPSSSNTVREGEEDGVQSLRYLAAVAPPDVAAVFHKVATTLLAEDGARGE